MLKFLNWFVSILLFPVRFFVFLIGFVAYWMEVAADWLIGASGKTEYVRTGKCKRCGRCCRLIALIMPEGFSRRHLLVKTVSIWHRLGLNFRYVSEEDGWLVYRCGYFRDGVDGKPGYCTVYRFRHRLCRFFPRQKLYGHPSLHKDCGFKFVRRDVWKTNQKMKRDGKKTFDELLHQRSNL